MRNFDGCIGYSPKSLQVELDAKGLERRTASDNEWKVFKQLACEKYLSVMMLSGANRKQHETSTLPSAMILPWEIMDIQLIRSMCSAFSIHISIPLGPTNISEMNEVLMQLKA